MAVVHGFIAEFAPQTVAFSCQSQLRGQKVRRGCFVQRRHLLSQLLACIFRAQQVCHDPLALLKAVPGQFVQVSRTEVGDVRGGAVVLVRDGLGSTQKEESSKAFKFRTDRLCDFVKQWPQGKPWQDIGCMVPSSSGAF